MTDNIQSVYSNDRFVSLRKQMVEEQLKKRGVKDPRVLLAMEKIPRHLFVGDPFERDAYTDRPLPIPCGQTISQPYMVAKTTELLCLTGKENVLEIGGGSGYQSAVLAMCSRKVVALERFEVLVDLAKENLARVGISTVEVVLTDGKHGYPEKAPYDRILLSCACEGILSPWENQLNAGGILIYPRQMKGEQLLCRYTKGTGSIEELFGVKYVPLI